VVVKESSTSSLVFVGPKGGREDVEVEDGEEVEVEELVELGVVVLMIDVAELAIELDVETKVGVDEELAEEEEDDEVVRMLVVDRVST
jgi:hypothetical protein